MRYATALIVLLLPVAALAADIYRSVDAQGHVQYSDTPSPGAQLIRVSARNAAEFAASASANASASKPNDDAAQAQLAKDKAQQAVQKDVAETRAEQCKKATETYQRYIQSRRIFKPTDNGDREYLSDADADQLRLNARLDMEAACGTGAT